MVPVEPKPPEPRFVSSSDFTSFKLALTTGHKTIWAIRARIAQMVLCPVVKANLKEVKSLEDTKRGSGGFGSTGTK